MGSFQYNIMAYILHCLSFLHAMEVVFLFLHRPLFTAITEYTGVELLLGSFSCHNYSGGFFSYSYPSAINISPTLSYISAKKQQYVVYQRKKQLLPVWVWILLCWTAHKLHPTNSIITMSVCNQVSVFACTLRTPSEISLIGPWKAMKKLVLLVVRT